MHAKCMPRRRQEEKASGGSLSLEASLSLAGRVLRNTPPHGVREVLVLMGAVSTHDDRDIFKTVKEELEGAHAVTVHILSLSAEMFVCAKIAERTLGSYRVVADESQLRDALKAFVAPRAIPLKLRRENAWIPMAFPTQVNHGYPAQCACHKKFSFQGWFCEKCRCALLCLCLWSFIVLLSCCCLLLQSRLSLLFLLFVYVCVFFHSLRLLFCVRKLPLASLASLLLSSRFSTLPANWTVGSSAVRSSLMLSCAVLFCALLSCPVRSCPALCCSAPHTNSV